MSSRLAVQDDERLARRDELVRRAAPTWPYPQMMK
jgi:hypothetical protein